MGLTVPPKGRESLETTNNPGERKGGVKVGGEAKPHRSDQAKRT